jgi:hypothetical protein
MSKFLTFALVAVALSAFVSQASAGRHRDCCAQTPCCGDGAAAPAAAATDNAAKNNTAQAPQSTRSFSYQPSTNNTASAVPGGINRGRIMQSFGVRGAASKANGNY